MGWESFQELQWRRKAPNMEHVPGLENIIEIARCIRSSLIVRQALKDPFVTSSQIRATMQEEYGVNIASRTVTLRLLWNNLRGCESLKKQKVSHNNRKARLELMRLHRDSPFFLWNSVVWSDKSKFNLHGPDGRTYVRRLPNKELDPKYTRKTVKFSGGSVMVWGCFTKHGVGPYVKLTGKLDSVTYQKLLTKYLVLFLEDLPLSVYTTAVFQQDNAPCNKSRSVIQWLQNQTILLLNWPAQSPDLNPIASLWAIIKKGDMALKPKTVHDLWTVIQEEWQKIPNDICVDLVTSMPRRYTSVISQNGYPTWVNINSCVSFFKLLSKFYTIFLLFFRCVDLLTELLLNMFYIILIFYGSIMFFF